MRILLIFLLGFAACSRPMTERQGVGERIERVYALKERVDSIWPGFNDPEYDVSLVYYTDSLCYAVNPNEYFLKNYPSEHIPGDWPFDFYRTKLIDSLPFHMACNVALGDLTTENRHVPVLQCSSLEITDRTIPDLGGEKGWMQMAMHEYFHGFQFKHPAFVDWLERSAVSDKLPVLQVTYRENEWFRTSVSEENRLLLIALSPGQNTQSLLAKYAALRRARYERACRELNDSIPVIESAFETMEGTARYVEYYIIPGSYDMGTDTWLYLTGVNYCYATGFNIARLLDKLHKDYKSRLFKEGSLSLYDILLETL